MVNIHTDDRVLRVKIFLSFKVNPTQKICSSICFFTFFFAGRHCFIAAKEEGGGRVSGGAVRRIFGESHGFQAKLR